jgi:hypothetical protein
MPSTSPPVHQTIASAIAAIAAVLAPTSRHLSIIDVGLPFAFRADRFEAPPERCLPM